MLSRCRFGALDQRGGRRILELVCCAGFQRRGSLLPCAGVQRRGQRPAVVRRFRREGERAWESESLMQASNFSLEQLDLVLIDFETLILIETKSCVRFSRYTMFAALSGVVFFGELSIILLG